MGAAFCLVIDLQPCLPYRGGGGGRVACPASVSSPVRGAFNLTELIGQRGMRSAVRSWRRSHTEREGQRKGLQVSTAPIFLHS